MDLGATVLSIALAAGFVAFAILVFRVLVIGFTSIIKKVKQDKSIETSTNKASEKGFEGVEK